MKATEMDRKTLAALKKSIEHWERLASGQLKRGEWIGPDHCSLCKLFYDGGCNGCPVAEKTGYNDCQTTPYDIVIAYVDACFGLDRESILNSKGFKSAARKELRFLKSLLPKQRKRSKSIRST